MSVPTTITAFEGTVAEGAAAPKLELAPGTGGALEGLAPPHPAIASASTPARVKRSLPPRLARAALTVAIRLLLLRVHHAMESPALYVTKSRQEKAFWH